MSLKHFSQPHGMFLDNANAKSRAECLNAQAICIEFGFVGMPRPQGSGRFRAS